MRIHRTLTTLALAMLAASACGSQAAPPAPAESAATSDGPTTGADEPAVTPDRGASVPPAQRADSVVSPRPPRVAVLPSGRRVRISSVGTTPAGLLDVPDDIATAGWWRGASRLGDPFGSVLVAAHVDSTTQGLGPFAELLSVEPGARVTLRSGLLSQVFEISARRLVPQGPLTDDPWISEASGDLRLTLVTCAPPYVADRGGYQNLAVVTALPLGPPEVSS